MSKDNCWWHTKYGQVPLRVFTEHGCESITVKYCPLCGKCLDQEEIDRQERQVNEAFRLLASDGDGVLRALKKIRDVEGRLNNPNPDRLAELDSRIEKMEREREKWKEETTRLMQM